MHAVSSFINFARFTARKRFNQALTPSNTFYKLHREDEALRQKKLQEEEKRQKLLNQKVPIGKPTNAAILKAEKARKCF